MSYNPNELTPFELQFLKEYSAYMQAEKEFYEQSGDEEC